MKSLEPPNQKLDFEGHSIMESSGTCESIKDYELNSNRLSVVNEEGQMDIKSYNTKQQTIENQTPLESSIEPT